MIEISRFWRSRFLRAAPVRLGTSLAASLILVGTPASAEDAMVKQRLDAIGYDFNVDKDGDYKIVIKYSDQKRSQVLWVSGKTEDFGGFTIREVYSPAAKIKQDHFDGDRALSALAAGSKKKLGDWEIRGDALYFVVKVPEPISAAQLKTVISVVAATADDMEIEISGSRDEL